MPQQELELILLRQCASYLTMPIWLMDMGGGLLYYNEAAEAIVGQRFDEAGPMPQERLASIFQMTDEDGSALQTSDLATTKALREHRPAHRAQRIRGLDGVSRRIEVTAFPIIGQGGRHLGAVAIIWEDSGS